MNELISGLGQGIIPGIIVLIYLIATKWFESKKESREEAVSKSMNERVNSLADNVSDIVEAMREVSVQLHNVTNNIVERDKEKCKVSIELAFACFAKELCDYAFLTIFNNHISENKEVIESNTKTIVNSEFYKVYSVLSLYEINGRKVSTFLKDEWIEGFETSIVRILFNDKVEVMCKMNMLRNKLNIKTKDCANYIYNNTFS